MYAPPDTGRRGGASEPLYMRAVCPGKDEEDIQAMRLEAKYDPWSPEDLCQQIPVVYPTVADFVVPALPTAVRSECNVAGVFRMAVPSLYKTMPEFPWNQILNLALSTSSL
jgi:hypothetical protein